MTKYIVIDNESKQQIEILAYSKAIAWSVAVSTLKTTDIKIIPQKSM